MGGEGRGTKLMGVTRSEVERAERVSSGVQIKKLVTTCNVSSTSKTFFPNPIILCPDRSGCAYAHGSCGNDQDSCNYRVAGRRGN